MYPTVPAARNLRGRRGDWTPAGWLVYNFPPRCPLDPRPTLHPWPAEERHVAAPLALAAGASQGLSLCRHDRPAAPLSCTPIFTPDLPRSPLTGWKPPHHRFPRVPSCYTAKEALTRRRHRPPSHGAAPGEAARTGAGVSRVGIRPALPLRPTALPGARVGAQLPGLRAPLAPAERIRASWVCSSGFPASLQPCTDRTTAPHPSGA